MYRRPRIIPCLLLQNQDLVKTVNFKNPRYLGDPINSVKIFNNKGVDELCILDISTTVEKREPDFSYLKELASEAFMPLSYGGGITDLDQIRELIFNGYEKVIINTAFVMKPELIKHAVACVGSQSIVVSIDVKTDVFGKRKCYIQGGRVRTKDDPVTLARRAEEFGAGEILLNSIDQDGMMKGYDLNLVRDVVKSVKIPVIACGGAGTIKDIKDVLHFAGAHAAAAGSFFVYYGPRKAVLITAPSEDELIKADIYQE